VHRRVALIKAIPPGARRNAGIAAAQIHSVARILEPRVASAFLAAIKNIKSTVTLASLARAIERGDIEDVLAILGVRELAKRMAGAGLEPGATTFQNEIIESFRRGGAAGMSQLPRRAALQASLDLTNPEAVRYLSLNLPTSIREITDETVRAVQQSLMRGFNEGRPAAKIAREIRGVVGLTEAQAGAVGNFRHQLETGDMGTMTAPWDRRLSATERAQARRIFTSGGARGGQTDALVARYEQSLINRRAKNIARTEVTRAFGAGQAELWGQAEEQGLLAGAKTRRHWLVTRDERSRKQHRAVPGMNPDGVGLHEPFQTPIGPVDQPRESGDAGFDINCRCTVYLEIEDA